MTSRATVVLFPALAALSTPGHSAAGAVNAEPELDLCKTKPSVMAALSRASTQARAVPMGQRLILQLSPEKSVVFPGVSTDLDKERAKAKGATTYSGVVRLEVTRPGIHRVSVDREAWLDVATATGELLDPAPEEGMFVCDGARKVLLYGLPAPGTYWLQVALSPRRETELTVIPPD